MTTTQPSEARKPPSHLVYQVTERGEKSYWTKLGVAFVHSDDKGLNIQLESMPLDGRLVLRVASEKKE